MRTQTELNRLRNITSKGKTTVVKEAKRRKLMKILNTPAQQFNYLSNDNLRFALRHAGEFGIHLPNHVRIWGSLTASNRERLRNIGRRTNASRISNNNINFLQSGNIPRTHSNKLKNFIKARMALRKNGFLPFFSQSNNTLKKLEENLIGSQPHTNRLRKIRNIPLAERTKLKNIIARKTPFLTLPYNNLQLLHKHRNVLNQKAEIEKAMNKRQALLKRQVAKFSYNVTRNLAEREREKHVAQVEKAVSRHKGTGVQQSNEELKISRERGHGGLFIRNFLQLRGPAKARLENAPNAAQFKLYVNAKNIKEVENAVKLIENIRRAEYPHLYNAPPTNKPNRKNYPVGQPGQGEKYRRDLRNYEGRLRNWLKTVGSYQVSRARAAQRAEAEKATVSKTANSAVSNKLHRRNSGNVTRK
jgi:hypothetical protein